MAMTEKKFDTRILLKYDTLENWNSSSLILKAGEVAIAVVPKEGAAASPVVIKVGDGSRTFSQLEMVSALASDVYGWAKQSEAEFKAWLDTTAGFATDVEVADIKDALDKKDKALQDAIDLLAGTGGGSGAQGGLAEVYVRVTELETILSSFLPEGDATATLDAVRNAINAVDAKIGARKAGEVAATGVYADIEAIEGRADALEAANEDFEERVAENERKLAGIGAEETVKGLISGVSGEVATVAGDLDKVEAKLVDVAEGETVKALISAAQEAATGYTDEKVGEINDAAELLEGRVEVVEGAVAKLNGGATEEGSVAHTVATEVAKIVDSAPEDFDTLKEVAEWIANDKEGAAAMQNSIASLKTTTEGHTTTLGQHADAIDAVEEDIETLNSGLTALSNTVAGMTGADGVITALQGRMETAEKDIADLKAEDTTIKQSIVDLTAIVSGNTTAIATEKTRAEAAEASLLKKIEDEAAAARAAESKLTTDLAAEVSRATAKETAIEKSVTDLDGSLKAIAKSGSVVDLVQPTDVEIVFDCGSSAARVAPQA